MKLLCYETTTDINEAIIFRYFTLNVSVIKNENDSGANTNDQRHLGF